MSRQSGQRSASIERDPLRSAFGGATIELNRTIDAKKRALDAGVANTDHERLGPGSLKSACPVKP